MISSRLAWRGPGCKKCMPKKRSGRDTAAEIAVIEMVEVLLARMRPAGKAGTACANRRLFCLQVFLDRLDDDIRVSRTAQIIGISDPLQTFILCLRGHFSFCNAFRKARLDPFPCLFQLLGHRVAQRYGQACLKRYLGDPAPHRAGADDQNRIQFHHDTSLQFAIFSTIIAMPWPPPMHSDTSPYCTLRRFIS